MTGSQDTPADEPARLGGLAEAAAPFAAAQPEPAAAGPAPAPIVAIGASAGGLEAIEQFFAAVEVPSRFAFVIVQHLSPDFKSLMVELLAKRTSLAVRAVEDGMRPRADAIHLIPPGKTMTLEAGLLRLAERDPRDFAHHPIDEFFVSLAADRGPDAIGIVLSGSGSDGSRGARAIRAAGGRVLVQLPATARFSSMPQAAVEAGCTAEVMPPAAMAPALLAARPQRPGDRDPARSASLAPRIADCLAQSFGLDVGAYRPAALQRRLQRRMMLRGFDELDAYAALLVDDPAEQEALYQDLLIGPTGFLADRPGFDALERLVAPALAARLDAGEPVRVWVAGCATGEEAYSIAILLTARCRRPLDDLPLEITATDLHHRSLAVAAAGSYSEEAVRQLPEAWRRRYLTPRGSLQQVVAPLRRMLTLAAHDLLHDPPLADRHLVSCRNLLTCLEISAQARVTASLADALLPGGHLLLGPDETPTGRAERFAPLDARARLYRCSAAATGATGRTLPAGPATAPARSPGLAVAAAGPARSERRDQRLTMAQELLLDRYVPPSLLVDDAGQIIHSFGDAGPWLKPPRGRASLALLDMVVAALEAPLADAVAEARRTGRPVHRTDLPLAAPAADTAAAPVLRRLSVEAPLVRPDGQRCLLVSFDDRPDTGRTDADAAARSATLATALEALLAALPEPLALALAPPGGPLRLVAANPPMRAALGLAPGNPPDTPPDTALAAALAARRLAVQPLPGTTPPLALLRPALPGGEPVP